eukprot:1200804-Pyramimonas_sp.AAC.1
MLRQAEVPVAEGARVLGLRPKGQRRGREPARAPQGVSLAGGHPRGGLDRVAGGLQMALVELFHPGSA